MENARHTAYKIFCDTVDGQSFYNLALKKYLPGGLDAADVRFAASLCATAVEHLITIDYYLSHFITVKRVHKSILNILRLGVCQLLYMHVPESAAVNESVKLAKQTGKQALSGFVNAVLRNFVKNRNTVKLPDRQADLAGFISLQYGFPLWMVQKLIAQYGEESAEQFFAYRADYQETCIRMNALKTDRSAFEKALNESGLLYSKSALAGAGYRVKNIADIERFEPYVSGDCTVMGEASMIAVEAAASKLKSGARLLDACSAPGGKAAYAAALLQNSIEITAWDVHEHRTELIRKNFSRLGVQNACVETRDASEYDAQYDEAFDLVMLDAPCSALGLLHKKPDIRLHRKPEEILALVQTQQKLIANLAKYVKKGGFLAYFTCTVARDENERVIGRFIRENGNFRPCEDFALPAGIRERMQDGMVTLLPQLDGTDGFFIALLERIS